MLTITKNRWDFVWFFYIHVFIIFAVNIFTIHVFQAIIYDVSSPIFMKGYKTFFILIFGNHHHLRCQHLLHHVSNVFILFLQCAWECLN